MKSNFVELLEEVKVASQTGYPSAAADYAQTIQLHWNEHKTFSQCTVQEAMHFHRFVEILVTAPEFIGT